MYFDPQDGLLIQNSSYCTWYHYQLQFHENPIKSSLKTHEPIFHGHENGDSPFHGLSQTHEFTMKLEAV